MILKKRFLDSFYLTKKEKLLISNKDTVCTHPAGIFAFFYGESVLQSSMITTAYYLNFLLELFHLDFFTRTFRFFFFWGGLYNIVSIISGSSLTTIRRSIGFDSFESNYSHGQLKKGLLIPSIQLNMRNC